MKYYEVVDVKTGNHTVVYLIGEMLNGVTLVHNESGQIGRMSEEVRITSDIPVAFNLVRHLDGEGFDQLIPHYDRVLMRNNISYVETEIETFFEFSDGTHVAVKEFTDEVLNAMEAKIDAMEKLREEDGSKSIFDSDGEDSELGGPDYVDDDEDDDFFVEDDVTIPGATSVRKGPPKKVKKKVKKVRK